MKLVLHNYWRSSASHRVRIGLQLKGLAYDYVPVNITHKGGEQHRTDAYRAKNPMMQVPTLEVIEADGTTTTRLIQSLPIIEYLDDRWPAPRLIPAEPVMRARARALAEIVNSGIQPLQNLGVIRAVKAMGGDDAAWTRGHIEHGLAAYAAACAEVAGQSPFGAIDQCVVQRVVAKGATP